MSLMESPWSGYNKGPFCGPSTGSLLPFAASIPSIGTEHETIFYPSDRAWMDGLFSRHADGPSPAQLQSRHPSDLGR